jgi:hypothetical protein
VPDSHLAVNPIVQLACCFVLFFAPVFGLGLPQAASLPLTAPEKICAGAATGPKISGTSAS